MLQKNYLACLNNTVDGGGGGGGVGRPLLNNVPFPYPFYGGPQGSVHKKGQLQLNTAPYANKKCCWKKKKNVAANKKKMWLEIKKLLQVKKKNVAANKKSCFK